ncbi:hypothetical protein H072_9022 [Dactylellina haptotyla CBS 200.50]|uniref:Uncharacterized protein n=1 Tax=Dactylellina haptotyla (strain CBS 200.50) TaxID=1284197 RepID=S8BDH9_DACHA|nr:hypothetical protein H072_9022 [Dactylellina haptotyla CBS 200.50]
MPIFARSKSRGEYREKELTSRKWLSGISLGNWNLGLNFEDEHDDGELLVNPSNAVMIDRSEAPMTWNQQVLLARARLKEEERTESAEVSFLPAEKPDRPGLENEENTADDELKGTVDEDVRRAAAGSIETQNNVSELNKLALAAVEHDGEEASGAEANGSWNSLFAKSQPMTARPAAVAGKTAESCRKDSTTADEEAQNATLNTNRANALAKVGRCVAGGKEGWEPEGGSQGALKTGIAAKPGQGGCDGGSPGPPIGMPLTDTPTCLSLSRDKDEEEGGRAKKQMPPMSFLNSHTSSKDQNKNGGDNATHAVAAVFSSSSITDNGRSFSRQGTSGTLSGRNSSLGPEFDEDPLTSSTSSRTGLMDVCMNDAPLGVSATNKNPRAPSPFLDHVSGGVLLDSDLNSSSSLSSSDLVSLSPSSLYLSEPVTTATIITTSTKTPITTITTAASTRNDNNNINYSSIRKKTKKPYCQIQTDICDAFGTSVNNSEPSPSLSSPASHSNYKKKTVISRNTNSNTHSNNNNNRNTLLSPNSVSGSGITRLHYASSYQPLVLSPCQVPVLDLTCNTKPTPLPSPSSSSFLHDNLHRDFNSLSPSSYSSSSFSSYSPSSTLCSTSAPSVAFSPHLRKKPPLRLTVLTTSSATPPAPISTSPVPRGPKHEVPLLSNSNSASPSPSQASSPIENSATLVTTLQPQIPVPIPRDYYRPQTPPTLGLESAAAETAVNDNSIIVRPVTASSTSTLSAGSCASLNTFNFSPSTPTSQSGPLSSFSASPSTKKSLTMAARSAAAQKSLMRSGAPRDQYTPFAYVPQSKHTSYAPNAQLDTAPSSSNSSEEFHVQHDIQTLQAVARQREQAEQVGRGRSDSQSRMQGSYVRGHGKNGSGSNELLENVFGIYPEKKSMGTGVSVADVVANKLFKWGTKKEAPSTIPTPSRESKLPSQRSLRHPNTTGYVGGVPQQVLSPRPSSGPHDQDYHPSQRDEMLHSRASNLDQVKLDELMARQKLLEDRINQLKMERDHLIDINGQPQPLPLKAHHEAALPPHATHHQSYMASMQPPPLRIPSGSSAPRSPDMSPTHSMSSAVHARQMAEPLNLPIQFPLPPSQPLPQLPLPPLGSTSPARPRSSRAFPSSKHIQPLRTTPMAIPSAIRQDPSATSAHYVSRPLPQPPSDATPPPEYEPPELSYSGHRQQYRDMKIKLTSPTSGSIMTHDVILEEPIPHPDDEKHGGMPSPRDDVDAEDILGWFETLKFASTGPRGRGPMAPLPRPEAGENNVAPLAISDDKKRPIRQPEAPTVAYYDVKVPITTTSPGPEQVYDMRYKKDWNAGRKKRSETRLRDHTRETENMRVAAV